MQTSSWMTASERLNQFAPMDTTLGKRLAALSLQDADENKMTYALESGRIYGLRQEKYDHILRRQIHQDWQQKRAEILWIKIIVQQVVVHFLNQKYSRK